MKSYRDERGVWHRTQAEAKASGFPWEMRDIPTDHKGLIDFVNSLSVPIPAPLPAGVVGVDVEQHGDEVIVTDNRPYQNGDPTSVFMKSRDPAAVFICTSCGAQNRNQAR